MKKFLEFSWLKWLPIACNVLFVFLFLLLLKKYSGEQLANGIRTINGYDRDDMLEWYDFFANTAEITLILSIVCSFFIKNRILKWVSVITGISALIIIYLNVGKFNPL